MIEQNSEFRNLEIQLIKNLTLKSNVYSDLVNQLLILLKQSYAENNKDFVEGYKSINPFIKDIEIINAKCDQITDKLLELKNKDNEK